MELTSLKVIILKYEQKDNEFFEAIIESLSRDKPFPLTVIYEIPKRKSPAKKRAAVNLPSIPLGNCNIYIAPKITINKSSLEEFLKQNKLLLETENSDHLFSGHLEVDSGDWQLDITSLVLDQYKEVIISIEGRDDDGKFKCNGRCNWSDAEGGFYFASRLPVRYLDYKADEECASIKFSKVEINEHGACIVEGVWIQNGEQWGIEGKLTKIKDLELIEKF